MKFKYLILSVLFSSLLFSCEEYTDPLDNTIRPGHIYCSDGSIVYPEKLDSTKTPIGVVFWANTTNNTEIDAKAFAVGLRDIAPTQWADRPVLVENVSTDINKFDGLANTISMIAYDLTDTISNISSSQRIFNYMPNTSWFIPSAGQIKALHFTKNEVNKSIQAVKGEKLNNWYWSSTQDGTSEEASRLFAYIVSVENGTINQSTKTNKYAIRPIITIK